MRISLTIATALAAAVIAASTADATITTSTTTVAAPFGFADFTNLPLGTRQIKATTNGTTGDTVDFICRQNASTFTFAVDLPVYADGSITTDVAENRFDSRYCRLMAVPSGTPVTDFTPFTGPFVGGGELSLQDVATGPNTGTVFDQYIDQAQSKGFADYDSLGDSGLADMQLFDAAGASSPVLFADNASLRFSHDDGTGQIRPSATVDGAPAYTSFTAQAKAVGNPGLPALTVTHSVDPATGDVTFHENQDLVGCHPSEASCTSFVPSHLRVERTVRQDHEGRWARITDVVRNLDGANSHSFDFDFDQFQQAYGQHLGYRLPGESGYTQHALGSGSTSAGFGMVTTIGLVNDQTQPVGFSNPVGAVTVSPQPDRLLYGSDGFYLKFSGTIPAGGTTTINQYFAMAASQDELDGYVADQRDELAPPSAPPPPPSDGGEDTPSPPPPPPTVSGGHKVKVKRTGKKFVLDTGLVVHCPPGRDACTTIGVAKTASKRKLTLARGAFTVAAGTDKRITLRFTDTGAKALKRAKRLAIRVGLTARAGSGAPTSASRGATIRRPR
jgi:hypothetical protein